MWLLTISCLLLTVLYVFLKWATCHYKTFEERGIPYYKPWPLVGNDWAVVTGKKSFLKSVIDFYQKTKTHKIVGYFNFRRPIFIINDPKLIKKIAIKDFEYFPNHAPFFNTDRDKMLDSMLSIMKDQRWKDMRNTLSPVFTASKMRAMFSLMNECFEESLKYLHGLPKNSNGDGGVELELKQCFTRLSNDMIASTAFGLKVNSYVDTNNEFYRIGQSITSFRGKQMLKLVLANVVPKLMNFFDIKLFDFSKTSYFMRLVVDAMRQREAQNIVRPDMIQLLMEAKRETTHNWCDEELVAQCFIFFFAAFENNANLICTTCHELMENPEVQQRVYEEAVEMKTQLQGAPLNYDAVGKLKYLDMVVAESLRKFSLAVITDRVCTKDYTLKDEENDDCVLAEFKVGDRVWFPLAGLQWDEKYFEQPEIFNPERFSDENKPNIEALTYIPFGVGPRICIGNRYALMQAKAMLYHLTLEFKLERAAKTCTNLMDDIRGFQMNPKDGFWMKLVARK